jgi:hypothetical protein
MMHLIATTVDDAHLECREVAEWQILSNSTASHANDSLDLPASQPARSQAAGRARTCSSRSLDSLPSMTNIIFENTCTQQVSRPHARAPPPWCDLAQLLAQRQRWSPDSRAQKAGPRHTPVRECWSRPLRTANSDSQTGHCDAHSKDKTKIPDRMPWSSFSVRGGDEPHGVPAITCVTWPDRQ